LTLILLYITYKDVIRNSQKVQCPVIRNNNIYSCRKILAVFCKQYKTHVAALVLEIVLYRKVGKNKGLKPHWDI